MINFNGISKYIDLIKSQTFINDELSIKLPSDVGFFLYEVSQWHARVNNDNNTRAIFDKTFSRIQEFPNESSPLYGFSGLCSGHITGLKIKKTLFNSDENQVNPEFIQALKKTVESYLVILGSNWEECSTEDYEMLRRNQILMVDENSGIKAIKNKFDKLGPTHCILGDIARENGLIRKIEILFGGDVILGQENDLKNFLIVLREASMETPSLTQLVCKHICQNSALYQNDEKFWNLPKDLLAKIEEEAKFCLKKATS